MAVQTSNVHTAVVLQGGGALGAYEYGILRALYEQRPGFRPAVVAGIWRFEVEGEGSMIL